MTIFSSIKVSIPKKLNHKFGMTDAKALGTPMSFTFSIDKDNECKHIDEIKCQDGLLPYLTASLPNIMFSVCRCSQFQLAPNETHLTLSREFYDIS